MKKDGKMHEGHRGRMLKRLETNDAALQEHEVLEILLYNAIPRKNTNEIAHELLQSFGSLENVFNANFSNLITIKGVGKETAAYLKCIGICFRRTEFSKESFPPGLNPETMERFLLNRYALMQNEILEIYCLDGHSRITNCSRFTDYCEHKASVKIDAVNKLFAAHSPHEIMIAHNHPTASCAPSKSDDRFTMQMMLYCSLNRIRLIDHFIVGIDGVYSYFRERRLDEFREKCDLQRFLDEKLK